MTRVEKQFVETPLNERTPQMVINASWLMESCECMLWALGYINALPAYDTQSDPQELEVIATGTTESFRNERLIDRSAIERARDVAELGHWRSRTRQIQEGGIASGLPDGMSLDDVIKLAANTAAESGIIGSPIQDDFPAFGIAFRDLSAQQYSSMTSIASERHKAFNWMCGYASKNKWDQTPTDT